MTQRGYFDESMQYRMLLQFSIAVRRQLDRWEALVSESINHAMRNEENPGRLIWDTEIEHRLLLSSCGQLLKSLDMSDLEVEVDPVMRAELKEVPDLLEHWENNMQIFNVNPRPEIPRFRSGKSFLARNPDRSPYSALRWKMHIHGNDSELTVYVTVNVSRDQVLALVQDVQRAVLEASPGLARFVPEEWLSDD